MSQLQGGFLFKITLLLLITNDVYHRSITMSLSHSDSLTFSTSLFTAFTAFTAFTTSAAFFTLTVVLIYCWLCCCSFSVHWTQFFLSFIVMSFHLCRLTAWRTWRTVNLNTPCLKAIFFWLFLFFLTDVTRFFFCSSMRTEGLSDLGSLTRYSSLSIWLIVGSYPHFQAMNLYW